MALGARPTRRAVIAGLVGVALPVLKGNAKLDGIGTRGYPIPDTPNR